VEGEAGNFTVQVKKHPRYVDMDKCIACGACTEKCPKKVDDVFQGGLGKRKAIHVKFAQAVPLKYVIDPENCLYLTKGKCGVCSKVCPTGAINYEDKEETISLEVGAVVMTLGSECYDPNKLDIYGYGKNKNVITSLEFERMLAAAGPFAGHLTRVSDKSDPKKIAFLQCVGSRNTHDNANSHCSSVCCSFAVKEAVMAKEHGGEDLDTAIFYIDMRTQGKDVERYYERAKDLGVRFIKSRIPSLPKGTEDPERTVIEYTDPTGRLIREEFDLVVLSVGYAISEAVRLQAGKLGIELNPGEYPDTDSFKPVRTMRPGVFMAGSLQAPKDIPFSVIDASACAGEASGLLSEVRGALAKEVTLPEEIDVRGDAPRIGVFICHCGTNIAGVVDCPTVSEYAATLPNVVHVEENLFSCSQDTQDKIAATIKEKGLNRVVVAACTPRTHEPLFQETLINAGLNKYLFEMANIRNQCSWCHSKEPLKATEKAKDLVRMSVARAGLLKPLEESELALNNAALVVGGGLAGMTASLTLANQGFKAYLVERDDSLGGNARRLGRTWRGEDVQKKLASLIEQVEENPLVEVFLKTTISQVEGFVGNFKTELATPDGAKEVEHGACIIATGATELNTDQYLHNKDPRVVTGMELEDRLAQGELGLEGPNGVAFLQCVGSRIPERIYCSKVCCTQSLVNALRIKEIEPDRPVFIIYRDIRAYGLREEVYRQAREAGVYFILYDHVKGLNVTPDGDSLRLELTDQDLGSELKLRAGMLVLASAMATDSKSDPELAQMFKVAQNQDGFFQEAHAKLKPVEFATDGVFVCGLAHSPQPMEETTAQGQAAAARAAVLLSSSGLAVGGSVAEIDENKCVGCGVCVDVCPYQAITMDMEKMKAQVNEATCKGCGTCAASCRSGAPQLKGFTQEAIMAQISAL
jgi:heterodisulfide reductase subunit A